MIKPLGKLGGFPLCHFFLLGIPTFLPKEFRQTVIVCGIGMFVLGAIGFLMLWLMDSAFPSFFDWLTE